MIGAKFERAVLRAKRDQGWDTGNRVLYDLCKKFPTHRHRGSVIAKIWLIGRSYAAAIERRRGKATANDAFYLDVVAPQIIASDIDNWISEARARPNSFDTIVTVHGKVTTLFHKISGQEKRSLASKYLHFHLPNVFFLYDTRAVASLRSVPWRIRAARCSKFPSGADNEYRKFAQKCCILKSCIRKEFQVSLTPRQIDNLLLSPR